MHGFVHLVLKEFLVSSRIRPADSLPIATKSAGAAWPAVANAHAMLASSCGLKSRTRPAGV